MRKTDNVKFYFSSVLLRVLFFSSILLNLFLLIGSTNASSGAGRDYVLSPDGKYALLLMGRRSFSLNSNSYYSTLTLHEKKIEGSDLMWHEVFTMTIDPDISMKDDYLYYRDLDQGVVWSNDSTEFEVKTTLWRFNFTTIP